MTDRSSANGKTTYSYVNERLFNNFSTMQDLILYLPKANSSRSEKRAQIVRLPHYQKLFSFLESRFEDGETYSIKNYFEDYKLITQDLDGEDKTVYGFIAENGKTYLGWNDLAFPKKLWKREIKKVGGEETITYTQLENKIYQGDLAILYNKFKSAYKDVLTAFDLLYIALAKHNESKFISESFIYPTETFQRFKGEYTTSNFYLFNLKAGGTDVNDLQTIFESVCKVYEDSLKTTKSSTEASAEDMSTKQITISLADALSSDLYMRTTPQLCLIEGVGIVTTKELANIKSMNKCNGDKEHTGRYFNDAGNESETIFTETDAFKEIEDKYGNVIDNALSRRDYSMPVLAIGLPFTVFGNRMFLKFVKSSDEDDIEWRFYYHYSGFCLNVLSKDNATIRRIIIKKIYNHFYESRFKKRMEGNR